MGKQKKKDAKPEADSSPAKNAVEKVESFPADKADAEATSTPESTPEAQAPEEETPPEIRDDAPLKNQLGEAQRLLKDTQSQNEKLHDELYTMLQTQQRQAIPPQGDVDQVRKQFAEELEEYGLPGEAAASFDRRIAGALSAAMQQTIMPAQQMNHDALTRTAMADAVRNDKRLEPYKKELEDVIFKLTPADVRVNYAPDAIVRQAAGQVAYAHMDDIVSQAKSGATAEAESARKIEGETLSGASVTLKSGETVNLSQFEKDFCDQKDWPYEKLANAKQRATDNRKMALPEGA